MITYNCRFPTFTPAGLIAATGGLITGASMIAALFPGTNRSFLITEIELQGQGVASAAGEYSLFRTITTAAVGALTLVVTPKPVTSLATQPAFSGSAGQGAFATTQPTLEATPTYDFGDNANGQRYFWRANPNLDNAIDMPGTATALLNGVVLVQTVGTLSPVSARFQIKEI